jgi:disulfide bond formation protein DsbB
MKIEIRLALFGMTFVGGLALIYWLTSYEDAGTTLLALGAAMYALLAGYLIVQHRRSAGRRPRPEDVEEPPPAEPETPVGYFPANSVWPAALGLGAVVVALGLVFGYWFFVIAAILLLGAVVGYAVEAQARP